MVFSGRSGSEISLDYWDCMMGVAILITKKVLSGWNKLIGDYKMGLFSYLPFSFTFRSLCCIWFLFFFQLCFLQ